MIGKNIPLKPFPRVLLLLSICMFFAGCGLHYTQSYVVPDAPLGNSETYYVERFTPDSRGLEKEIAKALRNAGYNAIAVEPGSVPSDAHAVITYQDKWQWDITMIMVKINIQVRNPESRHPYVVTEFAQDITVRTGYKDAIAIAVEDLVSKMNN